MQKIKKLLLFLLPVILSSFEICAQVGLVYSLEVCNVTGIFVHFPLAFLGGFAFFFVLFGKGPKQEAKIRIPVFLGASLVYSVLWVCLIGFHYYTAGIIVSSVVLSACSFFYYGTIWNRKGLVTAVVTLVVTLTLSMPYFADVIQIARREKEVPLTSYDDPDLLPHAKKAKVIYNYIWDDEEATMQDSDYCMFFQTLQGQLCLHSEEQLFITYVTGITPAQKKYVRKNRLDMEEFCYDNYEKYIKVGDDQMDMMKKYFDVTIEDVDTFSGLMDKVAGKVKNFILCDSSDPVSTSIGVSLCNQLNAVLIPKGLEYIAKKYRWKLVFSTVGKTLDWFTSSSYFDNLNKNIIIMPPVNVYHMGAHCDYAVLSNAWFVPQVTSEKQMESYLKYANRGFTFWGIRGEYLTENAMVSLTAKYGGTYLYAHGMRNLSVLSGFRLEDVVCPTSFAKETTVTDFDATPVENKHSVCIMFSDGDNMQYTAENNLYNIRQFGSPKRSEDYAVNYGMSGMMIELIPIMWLSYLEKVNPNESLVMQLSSIAYTYPSKWTDEEAFDEMMKLLVHSMEISNLHLVEIMDDISVMNTFDIPSQFDSMQKYFDKYTAQDQINGCLFIPYQERYAGFNGEVCWSNDKPIVSAKYSIWSAEKGGTEQNSIEYIAEQINNASTCVSSEEAYTFIIVHAWSGLDEDGNLVSGGDTMSAIQKLADLLDEDVDLVNCDEFIARMRRYVER